MISHQPYLEILKKARSYRFRRFNNLYKQGRFFKADCRN